VIAWDAFRLGRKESRKRIEPALLPEFPCSKEPSEVKGIIGEEVIPVSTGSVVFGPPGIRHGIRAVAGDRLALIFIKGRRLHGNYLKRMKLYVVGRERGGLKNGTGQRAAWDLIVYEFPDKIDPLRWCGLPAGGEQ
jgi:hypothetical protein